MMQYFWDSALELTPDDEDETRSENSLKNIPLDGGEAGQSIPYPSSTSSSMFAFKIEDRKGRKHRFLCDTQNMADLITAILQRVGDDINRTNPPHILYEDEDKDKFILASSSDLQAAVDHARLAGWKGLRLHLNYSLTPTRQKGSNLEYAQADAWASSYSVVASGAALVAGLGVLAFLRRN